MKNLFLVLFMLVATASFAQTANPTPTGEGVAPPSRKKAPSIGVVEKNAVPTGALAPDEFWLWTPFGWTKATFIGTVEEIKRLIEQFYGGPRPN